MKQELRSFIDREKVDEATKWFSAKVNSLYTTRLVKYPLLLELALWWYDRKYLKKIKKCING